jgi:predicted acyltransferase
MSLDVFRGLTIAGMLLVNNPGNWGNIYPPLRHAPWHGWTPTDLIFPFFLFIVGITTVLSINARRERGDEDYEIRRAILRRGALIFVFGLLLNFFPGFTWGTVAGNPDPSFLERIADRVAHLRIMGVLQRIALAYTVAALLALLTTLRTQVIICVALLYLSWWAFTLLPVPGTGLIGYWGNNIPAYTLQGWLDRIVLGQHMWVGASTHDPEGILSTFAAIATALTGVFAGRWIADSARPLEERLNGLFAVGAIAMVVGLMWHWSYPINKNLWTSSYVVFTSGMAAVALATVMWVIEIGGYTRWAKPLVIYGMNPIVAFVGSGIMARLIYSIIKVPLDGTRVSLVEFIYRQALLPWLSPQAASLAFAMLFVLTWLGILSWMYQRRIFLKV